MSIRLTSTFEKYQISKAVENSMNGRFDIPRDICSFSTEDKFIDTSKFATKFTLKDTFGVSANNLQEALEFTLFTFSDTVTISAIILKVGVGVTTPLGATLLVVNTYQGFRIIQKTINEINERNAEIEKICGDSRHINLEINSNEKQKLEFIERREKMLDILRESNTEHNDRKDRIEFPQRDIEMPKG